MVSDKKSVTERHGDKGSFTGRRNSLLPLFCNANTCGKSSWRETFGYERRPEKTKAGKPFNVRGEPKSSSDS